VQATSCADPSDVHVDAVNAGEPGAAGRGEATAGGRSGVDGSVTVLGVSGAVVGGRTKSSEPHRVQFERPGPTPASAHHATPQQPQKQPHAGQRTAWAALQCSQWSTPCCRWVIVLVFTRFGSGRSGGWAGGDRSQPDGVPIVDVTTCCRVAGSWTGAPEMRTDLFSKIPYVLAQSARGSPVTRGANLQRRSFLEDYWGIAIAIQISS